jgi:uncharacterized repeat protein (TIGR03803 family)
MKCWDFWRYTVGIGAATALLAGCGGGSQPPIGAPVVGMPLQAQMRSGAAVARDSTIAHHNKTASPSYQVVYRFAGGTDGQNPQASLIDVNGTLYGTTTAGGAYCEGSASTGCGTVFSVTPTGTEDVLHSFGNGADGTAPTSSLINVKGRLYSTTEFGGANGDGTVFSITSAGAETVLHSFGDSGDGADPYASLINVKGTLYGTTQKGGNAACYLGFACGTVFKITPSGKESIVYSFKGSYYGDGAYPAAPLVNVNGTLYGTTPNGGRREDGTVFAVTQSGAENVLHSFNIVRRRESGAYPYAALIDVNGTLYGATRQGGGSNFGTIFSITPSGAFAVLLSFNLTDGAFPHAGLINVKGTLYGTTEVGGAHGVGTVFAIRTSGMETVLHSFGGSGDGEYPLAGLINLKGTLYGTTYAGGSTSCSFSGYSGCGTVFSLTP